MKSKYLERLQKASRYFAFAFDQEVLRQKIEKEYQSCDIRQDYRIRISLSKSGEIEIERQVLTPLSSSFVSCFVSKKLIWSRPLPTLRRQTDHLTVGEQEIIYHTADGKLLETSIGNLVLEMNSKLYTPPSILGILL